MKKLLKILPFFVAIFITIYFTNAYYQTSTEKSSSFKTQGYSFKLNASGGTFSPSNRVINVNSELTLPTPNKTGYSFSGYSTSQNGSVNYSINIDNFNLLNNKEIYAVWTTNTYSISYNLNGGTISNQKTNYNVEETFTLPTPSKTGYSFGGWTGSNGSTKQSSVTVPKGTTGNLNYIANWTTNKYTVDVNPVIDGTAYNSGLDGYTFNVWINDNLVASSVKDWCQEVDYGSRVRVQANAVTGRNTNFDKTITVGASTVDINPSWSTNTYESHFYLNGTHRLTTYNKYGAYISTPNTSASALGYDGNFYYISGFTPWTTWYQPEYAVGFNIDIAEYNCTVSLGSAGASNARAQLTKVQANGYNFCTVDAGWGALVCTTNYSQAMALYNNAWNFLPRSGSGYSIYKQIGCDSGWSTYARR